MAFPVIPGVRTAASGSVCHPPALQALCALTQAFSKKIENHVYPFALHTMYHNFVNISAHTA